MPNQSQFKTTNYMVPSSGQTHAVVFGGLFSASPYLIDWRQYAIDNEKFQPQGVFMDNTLGTVPLVLSILPINYTVVCPAGKQLQAQFPAPNGQTASVTGDPANSATLIFVDFPVLPSANQTSITGSVDVNLASANPAAVVTTNPNPLAAGNTLPYRTQEYVAACEAKQFTIAAAATTGTVSPATVNQNLRMVQVAFSGASTKAAAGDVLLTLTLNGVVFFKENVYVPTAIPAGGQGVEYRNTIDLTGLGLNAAAGALTATLSAALTTGNVDVNAFFTPQ